MPFLPEDYKKIPSNSDYMKFQDGENVFRVLSSAVVGYEYWNIDNQPVRSKERWENIPADCKEEEDGTYKINHFWAFAVWNYSEKKVMILQITQKTVMQPLKTLVENVRWGDPKNYDILVNKTKEGGKTNYTVQALPPIAPADPKILEAYAKKNVNLEALFGGGDPFKSIDTKDLEGMKPEQAGVPTASPETAAELVQPAKAMSPEEEQNFLNQTPADIVAKASGGKFDPRS